MRQNELGAEQAVRARYEEQREMDRLAIHEQACVRAIETHCGGRPELVGDLVDRLQQDQLLIASVALGLTENTDKSLLVGAMDEAQKSIVALLAQLPEATK